jgi:hypothetical protein
MTAEDYKELEHLLNKLNIEIGATNKIVLIPNYVHDGYCMGVYNSSGQLTDEYVCATIESCVRKHNSQMIMK